MKRQYELMLVLAPTIDEKDTHRLEEIVVKIAGTEASSVKQLKTLGKKQLAYPIKKQTEGVYVVADIEGDGLHVSDIEKRVQMGTDVLRYLLTVKSA